MDKIYYSYSLPIKRHVDEHLMSILLKLNDHYICVEMDLDYVFYIYIVVKLKLIIVRIGDYYGTWYLRKLNKVLYKPFIDNLN